MSSGLKRSLDKTFNKNTLSFAELVRAQHLLKARVHLGHQRSKLHPKVSGLLTGFRNDVAIFDINKTWRSMRSVFYAFSEMASFRSSFFC